MYSLRLRRTLTTISPLINHYRHSRSVPTIPTITAPSPSLYLTQTLISSSPPTQSRPFKTSSALLSRARTFNNSHYEDDKLDPNAILFEGCDYNHWLITMDFPKDHSKPSDEEMVNTYVQTCAQGLNISIEEAKKRMYACSTTTYQGFQAVMTEEESEKFRDLPGVVFILPDSYIDPINKEYGGDKYDNGIITRRPPPVRYGRQGNRTRNTEQQRPNLYNRQCLTEEDGRNYGASQRGYDPMGQGDRRGSMPMNNNNYSPGGRSSYQGQGDTRGPMPSFQDNYNQADPRNYATSNQNYGPSHGVNYRQGAGGPYGQQTGRPYDQEAGAQGQGAVSEGMGGRYGQEAGPQEMRASYEQGPGSQGMGRSYGQEVGSLGMQAPFGQGGRTQGVGGTNGQGAGYDYGQIYPGQGEVQRSPPQADQRNQATLGQSWTDQGRY